MEGAKWQGRSAAAWESFKGRRKYAELPEAQKEAKRERAAERAAAARAAKRPRLAEGEEAAVGSEQAPSEVE